MGVNKGYKSAVNYMLAVKREVIPEYNTFAAAGI